MRTGFLTAIIFCFLVIGVGCMDSSINQYDEKGSQTGQDVLAPNNESTNKEQGETIKEEIPIVLYFSDTQAEKLVAEKRNVPKANILKNVEETIIIELIKGPQNQELSASIPQNTKLLSVKKEADLVTINFSKEFVENHPGGSSAETFTIYSIVNSLTELKDVEKVKFLIEGKEEEEYKGHYQFDIPFIRNEELIKPS